MLMVVHFGMAVAQPTSAPSRDVQWPSAETPAYPNSPYHGMTDGNGQVIPCRCKFSGQDYKLGQHVCMSTPVGTVLARCDLMLNNTSWVPTNTPCVIGMSPASSGTDLAALPR